MVPRSEQKGVGVPDAYGVLALNRGWARRSRCAGFSSWVVLVPFGLLLTSGAVHTSPTFLSPSAALLRRSAEGRRHIAMQGEASILDRLFDVATGAQGKAKKQLLAAIREADSGEAETQDVSARIDNLIDVLSKSPAGQQFSDETVDGDWVLIFTRNADGSPALQKMSRTKPGGTFANFEASESKFENLVQFLDGQIRLSATVAYKSTSTEPARISCDIVDANLCLGGLPALPLPLRAQGGWLDFLYLDEDMRITKGNKGGVFVHVRPQRLASIFGN